MECERLNRLVRSWYVQVQEESLAPARMVEFMEKHLEGCDECLADPVVRHEVKKITEIVLPPTKMTKVAKSADDETDNSPPVASTEAPDEVDDEYDDDDDDDDADDDEEPDLIEDKELD